MFPLVLLSTTVVEDSGADTCTLAGYACLDLTSEITSVFLFLGILVSMSIVIERTVELAEHWAKQARHSVLAKELIFTLTRELFSLGVFAFIISTIHWVRSFMCLLQECSIAVLCIWIFMYVVSSSFFLNLYSLEKTC
jgi:protein-S-isoprenylcysteine O-methyltransferase Ste14